MAHCAFARPAYIRPACGQLARNAHPMQDIAFGLGHFLEWTFTFLAKMGWGPVTATAIILFVGLLYWLNLQGKYNRKARQNGTLA